MDYTYEDVFIACEEVKLLIKEKKNRKHLDMRNYLIAILYYKFLYTEEAIADIFNIDRCTIHHSKFQPGTLQSVNDISFSINVSNYAMRFPYQFPVQKSNKERKYSGVTTYLDFDTLKKLDLYMMVKDIKRRDIAVKELIIKALKLWEE